MQLSHLLIAFFTTIISFVSFNNKFDRKSDCIFNNPDTSVSGIKIRDPYSTLFVLGAQTKLRGDSTYIFYSKNKDQILKLTIHPGDSYSEVSIFKVRYTGKDQHNYPNSNLKNFKTEKGICLGVPKDFVLNKLGSCYQKTQDAQGEMISYRLEQPNDSKTKLLQRHNMPIYFAVYYFKKNKLTAFDFGFEYP